MKGVVFTEFLDYVGARFGDDMVDDMIEAANVPSGGAYTAVGTYNHAEMVALCEALATRTNSSMRDIVCDFGDRLSDTFARDFPDFYRRANNLFDFLSSIDDHIHVEVRKLYPDAELPHFVVERRTATQLVFLYRSPRRMGHLSEGLIIGSARQYDVTVRVHSDELPVEQGMSVRFTIDLI
jgi:hypothetical protein